MNGYVYILECTENKLYTGSTNDLAIRYQEHCLGVGSNFTKKYPPLRIAFVQVFDRIDDAFEREKQIQGWSRKKKEALINSDFNSLHLYSECQNSSHSFNVNSHHG